MHKLLSELNSRELRTVFRRLGRRGIFLESQAIVQITIYLVNIGYDPFTYRFPISEPVVEVRKHEATVDIIEAKDIIVNEPEFTYEETLTVFMLGVADGVSDVSEVLPALLTSVVAVSPSTMPVMAAQREYGESLEVSASGAADGESVVSEMLSTSEGSAFSTSVLVVSSSTMPVMAARSEYEESLLASASRAADGGSVVSEILSTSEGSLFSTSVLVVSSSTMPVMAARSEYGESLVASSSGAADGESVVSEILSTSEGSFSTSLLVVSSSTVPDPSEHGESFLASASGTTKGESVVSENVSTSESSSFLTSVLVVSSSTVPKAAQSEYGETLEVYAIRLVNWPPDLSV